MLPDYYDSKVELFIALAPIARLTHQKSKSLGLASKNLKPLTALIKATHFYDILKENKFEAFV